VSARKQLKFAGALLLLALMAGCSGINTGYGVSPASFLIPGLNSAAQAPASISQVPAAHPSN
jgi:hypothetical protein